MKNIFKSLFLTASIILITSLSLKADTFLIDISSNLTFPTSPVEVGQTYISEITITNENIGGTELDGNEATLSYKVPEGSTLVTTSSANNSWYCPEDLDASGNLNCKYYSSLTNGNTSNTLFVTLIAPSTIETDVVGTTEATSSESNTTNDTSTAYISFGKSNLTATKSTTASTLGYDEVFQYTITVSNPTKTGSTTVDARGITVTDTLPTQIDIINPLPAGCTASGDNRTVTCTKDNLAVDASTSFVIDVIAKAADTNIVNTANIASTSVDYNTNFSVPSNPITIELADIEITQELVSGIATVDTNETYRISVKNNGQSPAKDANITYVLDPDVTFIGFTAADWNCTENSGTISCSLNDTSLTKAEGTKSLDIQVTMPETHQNVENTASVVIAPGSDSKLGNNTNSLEIYVNGADLNLVKSQDSTSADINSTHVYTITVTNDGEATATSVQVIDTLDPRMTYISSSITCSQAGNILTCGLGDIAPDTNTFFEVTARMPYDSLTSVTNKASVTTDTDQENLVNVKDHADGTVTTTLNGPSFTISKDSNATGTDKIIGLGKTFTYTIDIENTATAPAFDAVLTDVLPSGIEILSILISSGVDLNCPTSPAAAGSTFTCNIGNFPGESSASITFEAQAPTDETGSRTNTATITHSLDSTGVSDDTEVNIDGVILEITKSASDSAIVGGLIDYNITVTNTSHSDAETLVITDDIATRLPGYTIDLPVTNAGDWDCSSSTTTKLTCKKASLLAFGTATTVQFSVNVPNNATLGANVAKNSADVNSTTYPTTLKTSYLTQTDIVGADIVITLDENVTATAKAEKIYTVNVRNNGKAPANDVNVTTEFNVGGIIDGYFEDIEIDCDVGLGYQDVTTCEIGTLVYNQEKNIKIKATAPNYDSTFNQNGLEVGDKHLPIKNTTTAVTSTPQTSTDKHKDWLVTVNGSDLFIEKTNNDQNITVLDGIVTYEITVKNQGPAIATNIVVTDEINGTDPFVFNNPLLPIDNTSWDCENRSSSGFTCTYQSTLIQGATTSPITITAKAPNTQAAIDKFKSNYVSVTTDTAEKDIINSNKAQSDILIKGADLSITKTVFPETVPLEGTVVYTIEVTNNDLADAINVDVNDTLPAGFTNVTIVSGCLVGSTDSDTFVHCEVGDLAQGASREIEISATAPNTDGSFVNNVITGSDTLEKNYDNNDANATLIVEGADLTVYKTAPARVAGNSQYNYTIGVRNIGQSPAYGAEFTDTLPIAPNDVTYVANSLNVIEDSNWKCSIVGTTINCNTKLSDFEIPVDYNKNIVSFSVQAHDATYTVLNTVDVNTTTSESNYTNNEYTANTLVVDVDLEARKSIDTTYPGINEPITYTLQVHNASTKDVDITDVNYTDILPSNITNIAITPAENFTCPDTNLSAGDTLFCYMNSTVVLEQDATRNVATITANAINNDKFDVSIGANNTIVNRYKAQTSLSEDILANNAPGGDGFLTLTSTVRGANMSIEKSVSADPVGANQFFNYFLTLKNWPRTEANDINIPSTAATNIIVQDVFDANLTYVNATGTDWDCNESAWPLLTCTYDIDVNPSNTALPPITVTVRAPNTDGQTIQNDANVTNDTKELIALLSDNTSATVETVTSGTNLSIKKTATEFAGMDDSITYSVEVTNTSSTTPASDIYVLDNLPAGMTYDGNFSGTNWTYNGDVNGSLRFDYDGNLSIGSTTFSFNAILPHRTGEFRNWAYLNTSTVNQSTVLSSSADTNVTGGDIIVKEITQSNGTVGAYGAHQYFITIRNDGLSDAKDVNLTFDFENETSTPGWSEVNASGTDWSCFDYDIANSQITCTLTTLAQISDAPILTISSLAPNYNGEITNTAYVSAKDDTNETTGSSSDSDTIPTTIKGSDLTITKYAADLNNDDDPSYHDTNITAGVGKTIDFKFSISNDDLGLAKDIIVTDEFDPDFTDFNITNQNDWNCSFATNTLTCTRDELAKTTPATPVSDIFVSATSPNNIGTIENIVDINTSTVESDVANDDNVFIKLEGAILSVDFGISKSQVAMDEVFTYDINITNTGKNDAFDVNLTNLLNSDFTYIDNNGSDGDWNCTEVSNTISCNQPNIPAYNGVSILKLNVKAPYNTIVPSYINRIDVNSSSIAASLLDIQSPPVQVIGADLAVTIDANVTEALEDRNVTYIINVKDINISTARDVNLTQSFSPNVTAIYIDDDPSGTCINDTNTTVICNFGDLTYNEERNVTIIATMPKVTIKTPLTSTATAVTATEQENNALHTKDAIVDVYPIKPFAQYHFEECKWSGTSEDVIDSSIGKFYGSFNGTANDDAQTLNHYLAYDDNNFSTAWRVGSFDGVDDAIELPTTFPHLDGSRTITAWINTSDITKKDQRIFVDDNHTYGDEDNGSYALSLGDGGDGKTRFFIRGLEPVSLDASFSIQKDTFYFVAATFDKNTMIKTLYVYDANGTQKDKVSETVSGTIGTPSAIVKIGENFNGTIDEVEIYNIALDEKAITDIYNYELNHKNYDGTTRDETICGVDLNVIKTSSAGAGTTVGADTPLSYTITVTNESSEPLLSGFTLTDILPNNVTENNVSWSSNMYGCTDVNNTTNTNIQCTFPTGLMMLKDESEEFTINITTPNLHNEDINNTAVVSISIDGNQTDYKTSNNTDSVVNTTKGTDLEVFKTATIDSNESNIVTYTITVKNRDNLTPATGITITDTYDSRLVLFDTTGSCSTGNPFTCTIPDLQPGGEYSIIAKMTSENGTSIQNNVSVASYTVDYNLDNNDDNISVDVNVTGSNLPVVLVDGFRKHVSSNNYGRMLTIGNTILKANNNTGSLGLADTNTSYIHVDSQPLNSSSADLNISEKNVYIEYAGLYWGGHKLGEDNNDTLDSGFNKVKFETPKNTHTVVAGTIKDSGSVNSTDDDITGFYRFKKNDTSKARLYYASEANVTSLLRDEYAQNGTINGTFVVSGIDVSAGIDNTASLIPNSSSASGWSYYNSGFFGGWELVVIYSVDHKTYRGVKYKNSTIFDGFKALMPRQKDQEVSLEIAVDGFITPQTGTINSSLYSMVLAGDSTLAFESMSIENILNTKTFVQENNSINNIFNDTITLKNIDNSGITKNLDLSYNPGVDLDEFSIDSAQNDGTCSSGDDCYLSNEQTSTKIELKVKSDENETSPGSNQYAAQYAFVNMIGLSTQIFTPDFIDSYKECFKLQDPRDDEYNDVNASWIPCDSNETKLTRGSIIKYRITLLNSGTDDAINVKVTDELPDEVTFLGTASPENNITNTIFYDLTSYGSCNNDTYNSKEGNSTRATCRANIKNILTTDTVPLNSIPDGIDESLDLIDTSNTTHLSTTATTSTNTALTFEYPNFPRLNVAWIEFYTKINSKAKLGESFENSISIDFTNQTLLDAGVSNLQTQESDPIDSGAIVFNWEDIEVPIQDKNQNEERVGAKVVNAKFDLNVTLTRAEGFDSDANTTLVFLDSLNIIDIHNNRDERIYSTVVDANIGIPLGDTNPTWFTNDTSYGHASKELWFDMNLSIKEGNYTESKNYKTFTGDYAGDVFTTRPASFNMTFSASNPFYTDSNGTKYYIVKAGDDDLGMVVNALDANGSDTVDYNTTLFENTSDITVEADTTRQIDPSASCFDINDFNISDIIFGGGFASVSDIKYDDVGFIELTLKDSNWTQIDQDQSIEQCNNVPGDNISSDADGLINCNVEGNSTKYVIVFIPDHFEFISTSLTDQGSGFTYIVPNPIDDAMFGKITTKVVSKNSEGNTTEFFKNGCYADDVNIQLSYDIESENNTSSLSIGTANENDINGSKTINSSISDTGNLLETIAPEGNFSSGSADINLQIAVQGNRVDAMQPILLTAKNLKGTITHYRDVNSTYSNVADTGGTDINSSNTLHFIYGRVHSPDYRFADASGNAKIYYESYCKDCNDTKRNTMGISSIESIDSINWYINENHTAADGSVSTYSTVDDATFGGSSTTTSGTITNGIESITVNAPIISGVDQLPYKDKVEMNSTEWITFDPKDFIIEFQDQADDWAGQGQLGHIIDTNVSKRSNRRLDW